MEIVDVIKKLVGNVEPIGETHIDNERFANLMELTAVVDELLDNIRDVAKNRNCAEYSKQKAGRHAHKFLCYIEKPQEEE